MSGTIPGLSLSQRFDNETHEPLNGGLLFFFAAGTTTPQNVFQDTALTIPYPNPLTLDSGGNIPQLFAADGQIKFRLQNADGLIQQAYDNILVVGPSSGGGGGGSVDPTTVLATGDVKLKYGVGVLTGFVRANGRTIGSATSGAAERANADCQALFEYLWNTDANLTVSSGRGASSTADWVANKTITLPDGRGRVPGGLDDMGASAAGRLTSTYFGTSTTVLGAASTAQSKALLAGNNGPHSHGVYLNDPQHRHLGGRDIVISNGSGSGVHVLAPDPNEVPTSFAFTGMGIGSTPGSTNNSVTSQGQGDPFSIVQPTILMTFYIKL